MIKKIFRVESQEGEISALYHCFPLRNICNLFNKPSYPSPSPLPAHITSLFSLHTYPFRFLSTALAFTLTFPPSCPTPHPPPPYSGIITISLFLPRSYQINPLPLTFFYLTSPNLPQPHSRWPSFYPLPLTALYPVPRNTITSLPMTPNLPHPTLHYLPLTHSPSLSLHHYTWPLSLHRSP